MPSQLTLPDGRNLDYCIAGAKHGFPLIWHHGNPGAYNPVPHLAKACEEKGFTLITYSRPGFGGSSRLEGRSVVDDVEHVRVLLEHLGYENFATGGWSAGGPHALACAARLEGCVAAIAVASIAPHDGEGLTWPEGTSFDKSEAELRAKYEESRPGMMAVTAWDIIDEIKPDADKKALSTIPGLAQYVEDTFREALRTGVDGEIDDDLSFFKPWGFDVQDVKVPVFVYHGEIDPSAPFSHGQWLGKHIDARYVKTRFESGDGHVSIMRHVGQMLDEVKAVIGAVP